MEGQINFKNKEQAMFFIQGLIESFDISREELMEIV